MEEFLLKAKNYQIFLSLFIPSLIAAVIPEFGSDIVLIRIIIVTIPQVVWIFMLGKALNSCIPPRYRLNETMLIVNLFYFCIVFVFIIMLLDGQISFIGWAVIIPLYMPISLLYLFYFTSKALTSVEKGKRTSFGEHIGEMLILLTGIIGIWFIQPRINELWEKHKTKFDNEE